ncbi:MAG: arsenate reductase (glutaredoxin) [Bacteroidota bacterium]
MIKIYHNPRCSKSRQGLAVLQEAKVDFEIIKYLNTPVSTNELSSIIKKMGIQPMELVRTKEVIWRENFKGKDLSDKEIIKAMADNPKLIERPIVVNGDKAVLGRPAELIKDII